jgi:hypothetical protein
MFGSDALITSGFRERADEKVKGEVTFLLSFTLHMPLVNSGHPPDLPESAHTSNFSPKNYSPAKLFNDLQ